MIRQCAWCRLVLDEVTPLDDRSVTHTVCANCHARLLESCRTRRDVRLPSEFTPQPQGSSVSEN
jgi:hypothetical protein